MSKLEQVPNPTVRSIVRPTVATLQALLAQLLDDGWHQDQQISVTNLANAPEWFTVTAVEVWLGEPITDRDDE